MSHAIVTRSFIQERTVYEKVGESTEVALKVLAEKLNLANIDQSQLSPRERATASQREVLNQYKKVILILCSVIAEHHFHHWMYSLILCTYTAIRGSWRGEGGNLGFQYLGVHTGGGGETWDFSTWGFLGFQYLGVLTGGGGTWGFSTLL